MGALGALTGAAWGLLVMLVVAFATGGFHPAIMAWCAGVFGVLGALRGNLVADGIVALMHFVWGLASALADRWPAPQREDPVDVSRVFLWLGAGTGLALMLWWWTR